MTTLTPPLTLQTWRGRRIPASLPRVPSAYLRTDGGVLPLGGRPTDLLGRPDVRLVGTAPVKEI